MACCSHVLCLPANSRCCQVRLRPAPVARGAACALVGPAVPGRLGLVSGCAGAEYVVRGGWRGVKALMDLLELAVNGRLAFQMLSVQALDELMGWLLALEVRVMAVTEVELAARGRVVADPPAARLVTVVLPEQ